VTDGGIKALYNWANANGVAGSITRTSTGYTIALSDLNRVCSLQSALMRYAVPNARTGSFAAACVVPSWSNQTLPACPPGQYWNPNTRSCFSYVAGAPGQVGVGPGGVTASCSNCNNTVCWWCWGNPGFEDCKTECDKLFQGDLDSVLSCYCTRCVNEDNCGGVGTRATEFDVWRQYAATTCDTQKTANLNLDANGYQPLTVDCILGPRTCGAISQINTDEGYTVMSIPDACFGHESEWIPPTKKGAGAPPDCRTQPSRCSATQSCDQSTGECFEDCRKPGAAPCGPGRSCDQATGNCVAVPPKAAKKGAGAGVFVLGLAALLGIGFALTGRG
jgi:hypothetical protein